MRILHGLAWVVVALACAAPNCDTHDAPLGSGSGSSAWARMPSTSSGAQAELGSGSAAQHEDVVHAMETVTGASLDRPKSAAKPPKAKSAATHGGGDDSGGGGNYGRTSSSPPPKPPEPELPESGRKLGVRCERNEECASNLCEFDVCAKHYSDKLTNGEACNYDHECVSNRCYHDVCE
jgi:hypothetical protein